MVLCPVAKRYRIEIQELGTIKAEYWEFMLSLDGRPSDDQVARIERYVGDEFTLRAEMMGHMLNCTVCELGLQEPLL